MELALAGLEPATFWSAIPAGSRPRIAAAYSQYVARREALF